MPHTFTLSSLEDGEALTEEELRPERLRQRASPCEPRFSQGDSLPKAGEVEVEWREDWWEGVELSLPWPANGELVCLVCGLEESSKYRLKVHLVTVCVGGQKMMCRYLCDSEQGFKHATRRASHESRHKRGAFEASARSSPSGAESAESAGSAESAESAGSLEDAQLGVPVAMGLPASAAPQRLSDTGGLQLPVQSGSDDAAPSASASTSAASSTAPQFSPPPPAKKYEKRVLNAEQEELVRGVCDERDKACRMCLVAFRSTAALHRHAASHLPLGRYFCVECEAACLHFAPLQRHLAGGFCTASKGREEEGAIGSFSDDKIVSVKNMVVISDEFPSGRHMTKGEALGLPAAVRKRLLEEVKRVAKGDWEPPRTVLPEDDAYPPPEYIPDL